MNNQKESPTKPDTAPQQPDRQPTPETPRPRRRVIQPYFSKVTRILGATALVLTVGFAQAQTDTSRTKTTPRTAPTDDRTQTGTQPQEGWAMFDDRSGKDYNLTTDQMTRLRDVDNRYMKEYRALGTTPTTNPGYRSLSDRRNREVRTIMGDETYTRWERSHSGRTPANPAKGTTSPTPPKN